MSGRNAVWLSDNRRVLFGDLEKILLLDTETGRVHEVLSLEPDSIGQNFDLSSDDRTIYFSRTRSEADIWMVTLDDEPR